MTCAWLVTQSLTCRSSALPLNKSSAATIKRAWRVHAWAKKLLGSQCPLKLRRCKSYRKICSVCLEGFQDKQQITKLSYSHKFHKDCVLWLEAHPHCLYCRTPVLVSWSSLLPTSTWLSTSYVAEGKTKAFVSADCWKKVSERSKNKKTITVIELHCLR